MYKALNFSVPGSGTRFINEFIGRVLKYELVHANQKGMSLVPNRKNVPVDAVWTQVHTGYNLTELLAVPRLRVVTPLRHPYKTYLTRTFKTGYTPRPAHETEAVFIEHWETMIEASQILKPLFVPVDAGLNRPRLLHSIADHLEAPIVNDHLFEKMVRDWPKIGTMGSNKQKDEYLKYGTIARKTPTFLNFAVDWYNDIVGRV